MVKCPKCGAEVITPIKTWSIRKKSVKTGKSELIMGLFECPNCKTKFRTAIKTEIKPKETISIKDMVEKIKDIKGGLMQTLKNLREKK